MTSESKNTDNKTGHKSDFGLFCQSLGAKPTPISSVSQLNREVETLRSRKSAHTKDGPRWIFRAEKYGDGLKTTLERAVESYFKDQSQASAVESRTLREFKRRAHHHIQYLPSEKDTLQWLALMQHFGGPTRLMDWTYSVFVALFFAVARKASASSGYVIWAVDAEWLRRSSNKALGIKADIDLLAQVREEDCIRFDARLRPENTASDKLVPLVYPLNPFRLNERLTIQQGLFLSPRNLSLGFVENLKAMRPNGENLRVFTIEPASRTDILLELDRMNMNSATLFPGLQGFAESLWTKPICYFPPNVTYDDIR